MTKRKKTERGRMQREILETARGLHRAGILSDATLDKITLRHVHLDRLEKAPARNRGSPLLAIVEARGVHAILG